VLTFPTLTGGMVSSLPFLLLLLLYYYNITSCLICFIRLENPDAQQVKDFVQQQIVLTDSVLKTCDYFRTKLGDTIKKVFDHPRYSAPFKRGLNTYFYFHNTGLQPQSVLYVQDGLEGQPHVLLDPNLLSHDGTVSLNTFSVSKDATFFAYGLSSSGSDWLTIKVMSLHHNLLQPDTLSWVSLSLTHSSYSLLTL
jgi:prolyl oligopeptidase